MIASSVPKFIYLASLIEAKILASELKSLGRLENVYEYSNVEKALDKIHKLSMPDDRIIITGSFYTVGAAIRYLN